QTPAASVIAEGQSHTLSGQFSTPDPDDAHAVVIRWGDGSPDTTVSLAAGATTFTTSHVYADNPPGGRAALHVTVTDAGGASVSADAAVTVRDVAPALVAAAAPAGALV